MEGLVQEAEGYHARNLQLSLLDGKPSCTSCEFADCTRWTDADAPNAAMEEIASRLKQSTPRQRISWAMCTNDPGHTFLQCPRCLKDINGTNKAQDKEGLLDATTSVFVLLARRQPYIHRLSSAIVNTLATTARMTGRSGCVEWERVVTGVGMDDVVLCFGCSEGAAALGDVVTPGATSDVTVIMVREVDNCNESDDTTNDVGEAMKGEV